jgi:hypothetical protein
MRERGWIPLSNRSSYDDATAEVQAVITTELGNDPAFLWIVVVMCDITPDPTPPPTPSPRPPATTPEPGVTSVFVAIIISILVLIVIIGVCMCILKKCQPAQQQQQQPAQGQPSQQQQQSSHPSHQANVIVINPRDQTPGQNMPPGIVIHITPPSEPSSSRSTKARGGIDNLFASAGETSLLIAARGAVPVGQRNVAAGAKMPSSAHPNHPHFRQQMNLYASHAKKGV